MITLDQVFAEFFRLEGWPTVTDRPSDRGGLTKGGISFKYFNAWRASFGERPLTQDEFRLIDQTDGKAFLTDSFLTPIAFMDDEGIFTLLADWAMHAGVDDPVRALQTELARTRHYTGAIDGIPGPKTRAAWALVRGDLVYCRALETALAKARIHFHLDRAFDGEVRAFLQTHPTSQLANLRGWVTRGLEFL